jgi:hypothetical protein
MTRPETSRTILAAAGGITFLDIADGYGTEGEPG